MTYISSTRRIGLPVLLSLLGAQLSYAAECATPGNDGSGSGLNIVNTYWSGTSNPSVGTTSFSLGASTGAGDPIAEGDLLLLIQMQDSNINRNNSSNYGDGATGDPASGTTNLRRTGRFEYVRATNAVPTTGGTLNISSGIIYNYSSQPATAAGRGQRRFQIVRVPQYTDLTISGTLTAAPWNGEQGGVLAIDVANNLAFTGGNIDLSGLGFRGGGGRNSTTGSGDATDYRTPFSNGANGAKGEGSAGTPQLVYNGTVVNTGIDGYPNGSFGRGAPGNAGGGATDGNPSDNSENAGGGGGAGFGSGGQGGFAWCPGGPSVCDQSGGFGGTGTSSLGVDRLIMGGGGGAGSMNNNTGVPSGGVAASGERGGGIAIIRSKTITGSGTITVNGLDANSTVDNDGSGGGGGGGSILISAEDTSAATLVATAEGGNGGTNGNSTPHGPGGGGGGGFIAFTSGVTGLSTNVSPGAPGTTDGNPAPFTSSYGATSGFSGSSASVTAPNIPGFSSGGECVVEVEKDFALDTAAQNNPLKLTLTLTNPNPDLPMSALTVTDNYPANVVNAPTPNESTTCGGTLTATAGAASISLSGATLAASSSCAIEVDVIGTDVGTHINTIPAGGATADVSGQAVTNLSEASDNFSVSQPLTAQKTVSVISDVVGGASAYALPGSIVEYTIAFQNPTGGTIDAGSINITDGIPLNTVFSNLPISGGLTVVFDDGSPASGLSLPASGITFSNDGGLTFTYSPIGVSDPNVTHVKAQPSGTMLAGTEAAIRFRAVIK